jgi:arylsulfatase A-like enzyme
MVRGLLLVAISMATAHAAQPPNIVLVMADDQGWGDAAYNGHPILNTPNLDKAAATGLRFDRFYAAAPVCSPTRGSVLTGRHPNRFACFQWGHALRPQEITIAEALKTAGYHTGHFGKWHLGSVQNGSPVNPGASGFDTWLSAPNFYDNDEPLSLKGTAVPRPGESSIVAADAAITFMRDQVRRRKPFLAVVWFGSPHKPHRAVEEDRRQYADQDEAIQHFYGEITGLDRAYGKIRDELRTLEIQDNTILWYCSDNGGLPKFGSTGGRDHKGEVYEGGLRVPAILEWPDRIPTPRTTDMVCSTSDIYPTLLDLVGLTVQDQPPLDGVSLAPLMEGAVTERPGGLGFWEHNVPGIRTPSAEMMTELLAVQANGGDVAHPELLRLDAANTDKRYSKERFTGHAAWLNWPWKLHRIEPKDKQTVRYELYNLADDPLESKDLHAVEANRTHSMQGELNDWLESVVDSLHGDDYASAP